MNKDQTPMSNSLAPDVSTIKESTQETQLSSDSSILGKDDELNEASSEDETTLGKEIEPNGNDGIEVSLPSFEEAKARVNATRDDLERLRPKQDSWMKEYMMGKPLYKVNGKPTKNLSYRFLLSAVGGAIGGSISWLFDWEENIIGRMVIGSLFVLLLVFVASTHSGAHAPEKQTFRRFLAQIFLNDEIELIDDYSLKAKDYASATKLYKDLVDRTRKQLESEGIFEAINMEVNNEALPGESFVVSLEEDGRFVYSPTGLNDDAYSLHNDNAKLRKDMIVHIRTLRDDSRHLS